MIFFVVVVLSVLSSTFKIFIKAHLHFSNQNKVEKKIPVSHSQCYLKIVDFSPL